MNPRVQTDHAYVFSGDPDAPVLATAIHAGHEVRPELSSALVLDDSTRFREEDPFTDLIASCANNRVVVSRSRFEVDLNRPRDTAVYLTPDDCWGLDLWDPDLSEEMVNRSLAIHNSFYRDLADRLDRLAAKGPFVVFDVHSYNHRRDGADSPAEPASENPDVNVGTKSLKGGWRPVVDTFIDTLDGRVVHGSPLDVRENVRFKGAHLSHWVAEHYPGVGCALALEFKKTFMDEWTGQLDRDHLDELTTALGSTIPAVLDATRSLSR